MTGKYPSLFANCVLWWPGRLETTDGFIIKPTGVTATPNGTWSNDLDLGNNTSLKTFDGSTNYISLLDDPAWNLFSSDFTLSFWMKGSGSFPFIQETAGSGNVDTYCSRLFTNGGTIYHYVHNGTITNANYTHAISGFSSSAWYLITVIRSSSVCYMYVNGAPVTVSIGTAYTGTFPNLTSPLYINYGATKVPTSYGSGNIKDLLMWTRALTLPEIKLLMIKTYPTTGTGLIPGPYDYWKVTT